MKIVIAGAGSVGSYMAEELAKLGHHIVLLDNGRSEMLKGELREWDLATGEQLRTFDAGALWKYDAGFGADIGGVRGKSSQQGNFNQGSWNQEGLMP